MKNSFLNFQKMGLAMWLVMLLFLHGNAILKNDDPIQDGQTEAILFDQKMEQEKDGVKAAATPKVIYYGGQGFLTKSSLAKNEKEGEGVSAKKKKQTFNWSDWWEEKPVQSDLPATEEIAQEDVEAVKADGETVYSDSSTIDSVSGESDDPNKDEFWTDSESSSLAPEEPSPAKRDDWW